MKKSIITTTIFAAGLSCMSWIPLVKPMDKQIIMNETEYTQSSINNTRNNLNEVENFQLEITMQLVDGNPCNRNPNATMWAKGYVDSNANVNMNRIFYNTEQQLYTEFFRQALNMNTTEYVHDVKYLEYNLGSKKIFSIEGYTRGIFQDACDFKYPVYPDKGYHNHTNASVDLTKQNTYGNSEIKVEIRLNKSILYAGKKINEVLNPWNIFVKLDEYNTVQGIKNNYLGLDLDSNALKALLFSSVNKNQFPVVYFEEQTKLFRSDPRFHTMMQYFKQGKFYDPQHPMTNMLVPDDELNQANKNIRYWIDKLINNENVDGMNDPNNWLRDYKYIELYQIDIDGNNDCWDLEKILLDKTLKLEIDWNLNITSGMISLYFHYDRNSKSFIFNETNSNKYQTKIKSSFYKINELSIKKIRLYDASVGNPYFLTDVDMVGADYQPAKLYMQKYTYTYTFEITKLIYVKQDLSKQYWIDLFKPHAIDVEDWINNPEKFNNDEFKNLLTSFANDNSPIKIVDRDLDLEFKKDPELSLGTNTNIKWLLHDCTINTYNSVNGIELSINYFDCDITGMRKSDKLINKTVRYSLTNDEISESTFTKVVNDKVISRQRITGTPEEFVMNKFIGFENNRDNKLLTTKLSKHDWLENAFHSIEITENTQYGIKGKINYNENSSISNFIKDNINQISNSFNFEITFSDVIPNTGSKPIDNNSTGDEQTNSTITSMWIGIGSLLLVLLALSILYYFFSKNKKAKIINEQKSLNDSVENKLIEKEQKSLADDFEDKSTDSFEDKK